MCFSKKKKEFKELLCSHSVMLCDWPSSLCLLGHTACTAEEVAQEKVNSFSAWQYMICFAFAHYHLFRLEKGTSGPHTSHQAPCPPSVPFAVGLGNRLLAPNQAHQASKGVRSV